MPDLMVDEGLEKRLLLRSFQHLHALQPIRFDADEPRQGARLTRVGDPQTEMERAPSGVVTRAPRRRRQETPPRR